MKPARLAPALLGVLPVLLVARGFGRHKTPGHPTEMLFGRLFAGGQVRRWLGAGEVGTADLAAGGPAWWPDAPLPTGLQAAAGALVGDGPAHALVLLLGVLLVGVGAWALARSRGATPWAAVVAGLVVQAAPPVLRAAGSGEVGLLGLGPALLALAVPGVGAGVALALAAGAWSAAAGGVAALGGLWLRRPGLLVGLLPVLLALAAPRSTLPAAAMAAPPSPRSVPAYVGAAGAVLPLPPAEVEAREAGRAGGHPGARVDPATGPAPAAPTPAGGPGALARVPAGLGVLAALALALAVGARIPAALGLALLGAWVALVGLPPAPGTPPPIPPAWLEAAGAWVPGLRAPVGVLAWLALPLALVPVALARARWPAAVLPLVAVAALLENPRLTLPVTNLAPEPALATLAGLPPGVVVPFPAPGHPWRQGASSPARLLYEAVQHGHPVVVGPAVGGEAGLLAALSRRTDHPVDLAAAPAVWAARGDAPLAAARAAGVTALLVDRGALGPAGPAVDAWLAGQVGMAIVADERFALYDLTPLPPGGPAEPPPAP